MKELFDKEGFVVALVVAIIVATILFPIMYMLYTDYQLRILAIEHQCEKIYDANGYHYGNCKK